MDWHTIDVERYLGEGSNGKQYADPVPFECTVAENTVTTVTPGGNMLGTQTTIAYRVELRDQINVGSLVTLPSGRHAEVIANGIPDAPGVFADLNVGVAVVS